MPSINDVNLRWRDGTLERMRSRFLERDGSRGVGCTTLLLVGDIVVGGADARYADLRERLQAAARETMLWILVS